MCLAIPGKVIEIIDADMDIDKQAKIDFGGVQKMVSIAYVPDIRINEYVIVHVGFAISKVNEDQAQKTLQDFQKIQEIEDQDKLNL